VTDWQDISTAPRDGREVKIKATSFTGHTVEYDRCVWVPSKDVEMLCCEECGETYTYSQIEGWFSNGVRLPPWSICTHWHPLPEPPQEGDRDDG